MNVDAPVNILNILSTFETSHPPISLSKFLASSNIPAINFTFETSHPLMSPLKLVAPANMKLILVT